MERICFILCTTFLRHDFQALCKIYTSQLFKVEQYPLAQLSFHVFNQTQI